MPTHRAKKSSKSPVFGILWFALLAVNATGIAAPVIEIEIRDHLFFPSEVAVPAGQKVKLKVHNADPTPEEFESYELNREKVIMGGQTATIFIGPLRPGRYPFFGEFHPETAQGVVTVE